MSLVMDATAKDLRQTDLRFAQDAMVLASRALCVGVAEAVGGYLPVGATVHEAVNECVYRVLSVCERLNYIRQSATMEENDSYADLHITVKPS